MRIDSPFSLENKGSICAMLIAGLHATPAFLDQFHPACPSRLSPPTSTSQVAPATTPTPTPTRAPDSNVDLNLDSTPQKHHLRIKSTFRFSRCREVSNAIVLYCASEFTSFAISALALLQSAAHISPITSNFCVRLRLLTLQIGELLAWFLTVKISFLLKSAGTKFSYLTFLLTTYYAT